MIRFGIDRLLDDATLRAPLEGRRIGLLAHPTSMTADFRHSLDALAALPKFTITAAFGPQHGLRGDKQDNMIESADFIDPALGIPVFSLYGEVRRPTDAMLDHCDVILVDLQDLGCRIYTFITTLRYVLEAAGRLHKAVWVLDRPNPAGRPVEGLSLRPGWESRTSHWTSPSTASCWNCAPKTRPPSQNLPCCPRRPSSPRKPSQAALPPPRRMTSRHLPR